MAIEAFEMIGGFSALAIFGVTAKYLHARVASLDDDKVDKDLYESEMSAVNKNLEKVEKKSDTMNTKLDGIKEFQSEMKIESALTGKFQADATAQLLLINGTLKHIAAKVSQDD